MSASCGRSWSGDRFYIPPALRSQLQCQQQQQLPLQKQKLEKENDRQKHKQHRSQRPAPIQRTKSSADSENRTESDDCASSTTATTSATTLTASVSSCFVPNCGGNLSNFTNLDRFLEHATPIVPGQQFPKTSMKVWRTQEDNFQPHFVLGDLWESFKEWSAYGVGVPLLLNGSDSVKQYYVPYLSAIQLYIDPSMPTPRTRRLGEESDSDFSRESSDGGSDYETERGPNCSFQRVQSQQDHVETSSQGIRGLSINSKTSNGSSSDEGEFVSSPGVLKFEYLEHDPPYSREPLTDKISLLASQFPQLRTYRSCDLSPASWISVAWYPIYRIPTGPTLQNLDSCFLTFHLLSTPGCGNGSQNQWQCPYGSHPREVHHGFDMALKLSLPIFGLASYKFKTAVWEQTGADYCPKANLLFRAANDWLQRLNVNHPDYRFFASHNCWR